jgi:hypothetical protein
MEPTGFVNETDVPVVIEGWFKDNYSARASLDALYDLAKGRPDRKKLAAEWKNESNSWHIEGYELRLPVTTAL